MLYFLISDILTHPTAVGNRILYNNSLQFVDQLNSFFSELFKDIKPLPLIVTSAYRTPEHNKKIGGARNSLHCRALAIDLADSNKKLANLILNNKDLLKKNSLWLEDPRYTKTWIHLDAGVRSSRQYNIFIP